MGSLVWRSAPAEALAQSEAVAWSARGTCHRYKRTVIESPMTRKMPVLRELAMPPSTGSAINKVTAAGSIVLVGANGSGKTRLGRGLTYSPHKHQRSIVSQRRSL